MCLFPGNSTPLPTNDPTCAYWRKILIGVLAAHIGLIILDFLCFSWWDAILDVLAVSIAYCAIKDEDQYEVSRLLCYVMFMIFNFVFAGVRCCLFFAGVTPAPSGDKKDWQYYAFVLLCAGGTTFYFVAGFVAYKLYKSLKSVFQPGEGQGIIAPDAPPPGGQFGGGYGGYSPVPNENNDSPSNNSSFKPFAGQGHTLGSNGGSSQSRPQAATVQQSGAQRQRSSRVPSAVIDRLEQKARATRKE
mmetsp:Transcript_4670/g.6612  ORF Transcript_4670/g.6612 Transcript_4670/m.6612 type:complete len:245 (+) Transcript_4670:121-855(+)|eukprot:CAMPEP_0184483404 /NCGR_PEP_ID=MMETSP0113_2-20130426/5056_1 /TAXON_ID=91329 /ORGANISM="Norrisiella sphaerica, Strain BC52" /LENGTH=244 /DNA_ID=CAMNT_0026863781 /DNA_START=121 /DNA_END=855 /DNA_ORIENTATION=-